MKKLIVSALLFSCLNTFANSITVTFISPQPDHLTDSSLFIEVSVVSTFQVTSVTGIVNGHNGTLAFDGGTGNFSGYISLAGLQQGILLPLTVTATDVFSTQQSVSTNVLYVKPPKINIQYPAALTNAYSNLHIKGNCSSIDTCMLTVYVYLGQNIFIQNFTDAVDTLLSVPSSIAQNGNVTFVVTDRWGQQASGNIPILFNNYPYTTQIYEAPYKILDFNYNKVLYAPTDNSGYSYGAGALFDINTTVSTSLTGSYFDNGNYSFVSPYGAVYVRGADGYDWNSGTLYPFSAIFYFDPVIHTSGQYATFTRVNGVNNTDYYLRNLSTRTNTLIGSMGEYVVDNDVASNGAVAYWDQMNIKFYKNNITTTIASNNSGTLLNQNPLTDGNYVVYLQGDQVGASWSIYLYNGTNNTLLSSLDNYYSPNYPSPGANYQVANKFVAYSKFGTSGQLQVWLRDSTGVHSQVSFFNTTSTIEALNPKGDVMFTNNGTRYLVKHGTIQPKAFEQIGKLCWRDSSWFVIQGRTLYKLLVDAVVTVGNGNWNDPSIWENGVVPPADADVIILNNVTVTANATCNSLNVHPPGSITVLTGVNLTVLH